MWQKTITIIIDESGNSSIDLDGFTDNSCSRVFEDFRGGDKVRTERKKTSFYTSKLMEDQVRTGLLKVTAQHVSRFYSDVQQESPNRGEILKPRAPALGKGR